MDSKHKLLIPKEKSASFVITAYVVDDTMVTCTNVTRSASDLSPRRTGLPFVVWISVGQTIVVCGLPRPRSAPQTGRRRKTIVCPTGPAATADAVSLSRRFALP